MQRKTGSVVQDWLAANLTFKQQSVVLSALRGCDGIKKEDVSKALTRSFRSAILTNAEDIIPEKSFMGVDPKLAEKVDHFVDHPDHYPMHWVLHFTHAIEIVGYHHPDPHIAKFWNDVYLRLVNTFHMSPEGRQECDYRLRDLSLSESA